ncbi:hypothetical protein HHI36_011464 [Cryptolaemus montrouzieri]|uniref:Uncharacterized protein n=1 Tax=Cryptolaemus montrouzieri TaxID=559131 RepID=A0ABD2MLR6_9CUCU
MFEAVSDFCFYLIIGICAGINSFYIDLNKTTNQLQQETTTMVTDPRFIIQASCQKGYIRVGTECRKEYSK